MRILMSFRYGNIGPADWLKKNFQKLGHDVFTVGPSSDPVVHHDIEEPDMLEQLNGGIYYYDVKKIVDNHGPFDLILQVEPGTFLYNLDKVETPNATWLIDSVLLPDNPFIEKIGGKDYINQIGHIFTAKYNHIPRYWNQGIKHVSHLPLACEPEVHEEIEKEKVYDVIFLGNTEYAERKHFLDLLRLRYNTFIGTGYIYRYYAEKVAQAKICFNHGHVGEMNMRFFELMAMGAFQVCNIVHAQELLGFEDGIHLVNYVSDGDLINIIDGYLHGGDEQYLAEKRKQIGQNGKRLVLEKHTYRHRAEHILRTIFPDLDSEVN